MGMDLIAENPLSEDISYNWQGWRWIREFAERNGIDTSTFDGANNGKILESQVCKEMADAIEKNADEYNGAFGGELPPEGYGEKPATDHARIWRESGGFQQW